MITLSADLRATRIPSGEAATLAAGTSVAVTQTLGGSLTVRAGEGLFRIAPGDAETLGKEFLPAQEESAATGRPFGEEAVWEALRSCFDPEIPVNIVDLGLIYDMQIQPAEDGRHRVDVKMTLTAQGCGMGPVIADDAKSRIEALPEVESADVRIVWDPVWTPHMISPAGRKALGLE